ncbi:thiamine pyrophosphate-dependent enzyme [bacterium]|nr:thiamine pyrophosphate-dependent enzyme [bacterium]
MKRHQAIAHILARAEGSFFIHANGMISREAFSERDREENFYMIGSMGLASSIGLGVAMSEPERRVVVVDGDGNVLTNLGALTMVARYQPKNFVHIVLDNETYASTGGQCTISDRISVEKIAAATGYKNVLRCGEQRQLCECLDVLLAAQGPSFLLAKVARGNIDGIARVSHTPPEITQRFSDAMTRKIRAEHSDDKSRFAEVIG